MRTVVPLVLGVACAPDTAPSPGHPSGWTDVACPAVPTALSLGEPEPFVHDVLPPYTAFAEELVDSPYRRDVSVPVDTSVGALGVDGGLLVIGSGDWTHKTGSVYCHDDGGHCAFEDAPDHGMPLLGIDAGADAPRVLAILKEEEVRRIRRTGLGLLVPSTDPSRGDGAPDCALPGADPACPEEDGRTHRSFRIGNSIQVRDGAVRAEALLPDASHVFDVVPRDGVLWAVGSGIPVSPPDLGGTFAMLWRSDDDGRSWQAAWWDRNQPGRRRLLSALPIGDEILLFGLHKRDGVHDPLRYRLQGPDMVAAPGLAPGLSGAIETDALDRDRGLAWTAAGAVAFAAEGGGLRQWSPDLSEHGVVHDTWLLCAGDLLLLTSGRGWPEARRRVLRTRDLASFEVVAEWVGEPAVTELAWWDGGLVLGGEAGALWRALP